MKRLAIAFGILSIAVFSMLMEKDKKKNKNSKKEESLSGVEMPGPHGEPVLIGAGGGRYYMKGDRKIYLRYKT